MNAVSFTAPRLDDTQQRLLFKIAGYLYNGLGFASALSGNGSPLNVVTPSFAGQLYEDKQTGTWYRSTGVLSSTWVLA